MAKKTAPSSDDDLARRLNRGVRKKHARLSFDGAVPFGEALRVQRWRLGNGLRIRLLVDPSAPLVSYHTWFRVGSRHEEKGKTGLAHFFEHMMFNETSNLPWGEFDRRMEAAGAETNAATWVDWTYYFETLPADELPLAVELESDRMRNLVVREKQVESEREVVANERRLSVEDDVHGAADERLQALAYGREHPHGWPTIGWMDDIEGYRVPDCRAFYRTWYAPNNATVVVVGDLDPADLLARIQAAYGGIGPSKLPARPTPPTPRQRKERRETLPWPTASEKLCLGWHGPPYASFEHAVAELIDELWTGGRSSRLRRRLVDELELVSALHGGIAGLRHGGLFDLWISMREGRAAEDALAVIDEEVERLAREPVPEAELSKVKSRLELHFLTHVETTGGKAEQVGYGETVADDPSHAFVRLEELRRVRPEDVTRVARELLRSSRRSIVHVQPTEAVS
ncbi:MAG TPA: pitrilysin family protein [Sandaracinaceae bacterium LLY-WYZ-13_1]|nr:pitrilysin family protein [Sandaracinaceae bacterium LLY-WYZ-13_1]